MKLVIVERDMETGELESLFNALSRLKKAQAVSLLGARTILDPNGRTVFHASQNIDNTWHVMAAEGLVKKQVKS